MFRDAEVLIGHISSERLACLLELSELLRVLAEETRIKILYLLSQGELCVCDIMEELGLPQPLASHHLRVLREAGLVKDRRVAQWVYYSINVEKLAALNKLYLSFFEIDKISTEPRPESLTRPCP